MTSEANPFDDPTLAARYEDWYGGEGREADILEKQVLAKLLADSPRAKSVLEVGCGTGHFTRWLAHQGLRAAGLDISEVMLAEGRRRNGVEYVYGDTQALSFADQTWDLVALITTLEFVPDPEQALSEAMRVARQGLLLGVLNRWSLLTWSYRRSGKPLWKSAHFFTPGELKRLVRRIAGKRLQRIRWRTTLWPMPFLKDLPLPFGGFIGMAVQLAEETHDDEQGFCSGEPVSLTSAAPWQINPAFSLPTNQRLPWTSNGADRSWNSFAWLLTSRMAGASS